MTGQFSNDNAVLPKRAADPHGQAAILLVESLIHGLVDRDILSVTDAVEILDVAAEVKSEIGLEIGETPETLQTSINLLHAISASLRTDMSPA